MAQVFGKVESLKKLRNSLHERGIDQFNSIREIKEFQRNFGKAKENIYKMHESSVNNEIQELKKKTRSLEALIGETKTEKRSELNITIETLKNRIHTLENINNGWINNFFNWFRILHLNYKLSNLEINFDKIVNSSCALANKQFLKDKKSLDYLSNNTISEINKRVKPEILKIDKINKVLFEINPQIAGAIGEGKVLNELKKLSDEFFIINDISLEFSPPIYNRKEDDKIFSIQIDHLVISKAGIFILETKNWSKRSVESYDLRSPIKQVKRTGYAIFCLINQAIEDGHIKLNKSNWGNKRIPSRNIVVMVNNKPQDEFNFVKIVTLNELNGYIKYFKQVLDFEELNSLVKYLLEIKDYHYL